MTAIKFLRILTTFLCSVILLLSCESQIKLGRTSRVKTLNLDGVKLIEFSNFYQSPRGHRWARDFFPTTEGAVVEADIIKKLNLSSTASSLMVAANHAEAALRWEHDIKGDWIPIGYIQKRGYSNGNISMAVYEMDGAPILLIISNL